MSIGHQAVIMAYPVWVFQIQQNVKGVLLYALQLKDFEIPCR